MALSFGKSIIFQLKILAFSKIGFMLAKVHIIPMLTFMLETKEKLIFFFKISNCCSVGKSQGLYIFQSLLIHGD